MFDGVTWLLLLVGGVFLVAGGFVVRGPARPEERAPEHDAEAAREAETRTTDDAARLRNAIERMGYEHEAEQQSLEKQVEELRAELEKKSADLAVEAQLAREMETSLESTRAALRAAETARKDAEKARDEAFARGKEAPKATAPKPAPVDAVARARLADVERALAQATIERDAATQKNEALERLVEGVRARSRALAKELEERRRGG